MNKDFAQELTNSPKLKNILRNIGLQKCLPMDFS